MAELTSFGMVGDGATDNYANGSMSLAWAALNSGQLLTDSASGVFCFSQPPPAAVAGKFIGSGRGNCADTNANGLQFGPHGTVFRHTGTTGDTLLINGEARFESFSLWPTQFKTGGSEIRIDGGASNAAVSDFRINNANQAIHVGTQVNSKISGGHIQGTFGPNHIHCLGSGAGQDQLCNGLVLEDIIAYSPYPVMQPMVGQTGPWVPSTPVSWGVTYIYPTGWVGQCVSPGATGTTAPAYPTFALSSDPYQPANYITDGTAKFQFICNASLAGLNVDSYSMVVTVSRLQMLACARAGVTMTNSIGMAGSLPSRLLMNACYADHCVGPGFLFEAGSIAAAEFCTSTNSAMSVGLCVVAPFAVPLYWGPGDLTSNAAGRAYLTVPGVTVHADWM